MTHLLVTNDFPPKIGGIQSYLYELWRRLPRERFVVLTRAHPDATAFDRQEQFRIERLDAPMLLPTKRTRAAIERLAEEIGASLVVLDPALPLGRIGPSLSLPYAVVLHGAEVTVPARVPGLSGSLGGVLRSAALVISAGNYPAGEARRVVGPSMPKTVVIPPGVDIERFQPRAESERRAIRRRFGFDEESLLIVSVSRLVPRKGMDVLIEVAARLAPSHPGLAVAIGGSGRDQPRLARLIRRSGAPVSLLGRVAEAELPALLGAADLVAMLCRNRWLGLEQEGFGIVFLEAAASGIAQVAGLSGGSHEAVLDGVTGVVLDRPADAWVASDAIGGLLDAPELRISLGTAARARAVAEFDYDRLADRLDAALADAES